jgi:hypothetical protein
MEAPLLDNDAAINSGEWSYDMRKVQSAKRLLKITKCVKVFVNKETREAMVCATWLPYITDRFEQLDLGTGICPECQIIDKVFQIPDGKPKDKGDWG